MLIRKLGLLCKFRAIVVLAVQLGIGQALLADDPQIRQIDRGLRLYNLLAAFVLAAAKREPIQQGISGQRKLVKAQRKAGPSPPNSRTL